jgi:hypothetical protein
VAGKGRRSADAVLIAALVAGATHAEAAREAGVGERTVYRRLAEPAFRAELQRRRSQIVDNVLGWLVAASTEAVETLVRLQQPGAPAAVQLSAARAILDNMQKVRESAELEARISALEGRQVPRLGTVA